MLEGGADAGLVRPFGDGPYVVFGPEAYYPRDPAPGWRAGLGAGVGVAFGRDRPWGVERRVGRFTSAAGSTRGQLDVALPRRW